MKRLLIMIFAFISLYAKAQISPLQVQAKRGVFTERLNINGHWIDRISTDLHTPDSASNNVLATGKAIADFLRPRQNGFIKNQFSAPQSASFWIKGNAVTGSVPEYLPLLSSGLPAQVNVTYSINEQGVGVQRSSNDHGPASVVFFKNNGPDLNTLNALQSGDTIGSLSFSAHTGDLSAVKNVMDLQGRVEKTAPSFLSSGFVFNTTDTTGAYGQRMWLNAAGNLLLGNGATNSYRLNVADGRVRINSLMGSPDFDYTALVSANNDGVLVPLPTYSLWTEDSVHINVGISPPTNPRVYTALLSQTGLNDPVAHILQNTHNVQVNWTRSAPGVYHGRLTGNFGSPRFLYAEASDEAGNVFSTKLFYHQYESEQNPDYFILVVKDNNLVNMDGWTNISIQMMGILEF